MAITDTLNLTPDVVAEQNPDLHEMRKIAFGEDYLQDIAQGTGTAQYYTGWGLTPNWNQQQGDAVGPITADDYPADYTGAMLMGQGTGEGGGGGGSGEGRTGIMAAGVPNLYPLHPLYHKQQQWRT